jgi:hypothetical protein
MIFQRKLPSTRSQAISSIHRPVEMNAVIAGRNLRSLATADMGQMLAFEEYGSNDGESKQNGFNPSQHILKQ